MQQSPIFSKTYDFLLWLLPLTAKFPRQQRFVLASTLQQDGLKFQEYLIEAVHKKGDITPLQAADIELDKLRTHLRMSRDLKLITPSQYEHAARMLVEIGKLLGGWQKKMMQGNSQP
ncbi:MAG: diversity-generating retroelement protein Avd [Anaerolineae bacterium]|jgi:hypothetical protein|nr:diversity-generating retroelement protein Avd [Anaerolineae bacterium]MBT7071961.1 diversity-generating retroelement protein Avd [Anaerolineae bacterium]MBT7324995.1 diversity-generating retroelement protein Avd [Anaerolineae bacterium]